jgi:hypothetical protein
MAISASRIVLLPVGLVALLLAPYFVLGVSVLAFVLGYMEGSGIDAKLMDAAL